MKPTTILAVASMHRFHKDHPTFDYEKLFQVIADFHPNYVGVEIRPEDVDRRSFRNAPRCRAELAP